MKTIIKKPTILQMGTGLLISICKSFRKKLKYVPIPQKVGKYKFVSEVKKENQFREYGIGIYQCGGKKVFIKTWTGLVKDFQYYELINEYIMSKALFNKLRYHKFIKVPKIISYIESEQSFSIIYESIMGKKLSLFPKNKQVETIREVLKAFDKISTKGCCNFSKKTLMFYVPSLTFLSILTILSDLKNFKAVLRGYINFLKAARYIKNNDLRISHRDLNLHNILLKGKYIYLIDCARASLTYRNYDLAYLSVNPRLKTISKEITGNSKYSGNIFLENYILINQARTFNDPVGFNNYYSKELHRRYA